MPMGWLGTDAARHTSLIQIKSVWRGKWRAWAQTSAPARPVLAPLWFNRLFSKTSKGSLMSSLPPLPARPEPLGVDPATTAVIVIDMQNAYASPGGYVDLAGFDITGAAQTITKIAKVLDVARGAGIPVVYLQNGWDPDYVEAGGPGSPNWHKSNALKTMRQRPDLAGTLLARGTWDYDIVDALQPQPGDIRVAKPRYSAFFNSQLDSILRARGIRTLVFVGIATNVCVDPRCATDSTSNTSASCSKMPRINWAKTSSSAPAFTTSRSFSVG
jgi:ureidoacrylate peracid hydrolase